jgi:hypothetical protein
MRMLDPLRLRWSASNTDLAPASRSFVGIFAGAGRGNRTPKGRSPADFESAASASSAIPALVASVLFYNLFMAIFLFHPK